ncbi:putative sulfate exporter family transporter [Bdellovibrio sp. SKB1291214]|uniref:YeiH family protein n=1 Tax=Bdellovibrio sp. SKB1291214 TaxID=1732569 RepID=UPI000B514F47|nr:putative sulfate exporter family transporter [Bdellovibrio sp. SKB1291214]UYL10263.1 putative sulfate exporter family transporter [Bdellovibrio sp. SKB1291214]
MNIQKIQYPVSMALIPVLAIGCFVFPVSSALALVLGLVTAITVGNPYITKTRKLTSNLLSIAVIGLGAGMDLNVVGRVGAQGVGYTVLGISMTLGIGYLLGKILKTERDTSILVSAGTAICGGSAIAAVSSSIKAKPHEISVSLGVVFMLNALALIVFPIVGHHFNLTEGQFGLWSALAIHDTSSVVGATLQYGPHALEVGTTVKLARALWIVPVTLFYGYLVSRKQEATVGKTKFPWFILGFLLAAALVTWIPQLQEPGKFVNDIAKKLLVVTLLLIGANLTRDTLRSVGLRPLIQGVLLWIIVGSLTLGAVLLGWISLT